MLVPHLLKIYFDLGWPSSVLEIVQPILFKVRIPRLYSTVQPIVYKVRTPRLYSTVQPIVYKVRTPRLYRTVQTTANENVSYSYIWNLNSRWERVFVHISEKY